MMDQITIKDLEVYANHGLYKEEKALGQKFLVSAILSLDTKLAGVSDQMDYSVDYGKVCHRIKEILTENDFNLIECVAETVAKKLLLEFSLIRKLEIEVKTMGADRIATRLCFSEDQKRMAQSVSWSRIKYGRSYGIY